MAERGETGRGDRGRQGRGENRQEDRDRRADHPYAGHRAGAKPATGPAKTGGAKTAHAVRGRKVAAGGKHEIHVTNERVEVCPIERCPPLDDVVKMKGADPTVAEEVAAAEKARAAGDTAAAAEHAELALIKAHVAVPTPSDAVG